MSPAPAVKHVAFSVERGVAIIELHRPDRMNAWIPELGDELRALLDYCGSEDEVRSVLVRGAGRGFSAGADLQTPTAYVTDSGRPHVARVLQEHYHAVMTGVRRLPKPVIAAVHGATVGIGASLALSCDLIIAAESAYFLFAFVNIGLVPDGGSSLLLPSRIGLARATELAMLGERLYAPKALDWGLVNRVVPDEELAEQSLALAERMAAGPTLSYAGTKRQLNNWLFQRMDEQLELESMIQQEMAESGDFAEGVMAFLQKRQAAFGGR
ncbi:MAG TPA: enoyl-CoA hydratase-related protein [Solirubrobacteraceae bacterium]|nr:enoyl-CoA hydratase-related protein [Solirubrobacteraceae bacterium]